MSDAEGNTADVSDAVVEKVDEDKISEVEDECIDVEVVLGEEDESREGVASTVAVAPSSDVVTGVSRNGPTSLVMIDSGSVIGSVIEFALEKEISEG